MKSRGVRGGCVERDCHKYYSRARGAERKDGKNGEDIAWGY